jgi:hypothetical protein
MARQRKRKRLLRTRSIDTERIEALRELLEIGERSGFVRHHSLERLLVETSRRNG